jgi:hypothetical protein
MSRRLCACLLAGVALLATPPPGGARQEASPGTAEDFTVVDCLLPGRVRRLGGRTNFLTPRRPVRTTALDCRIRGGEYTEYDRASYGTALQVWLAQAQAGDAEAQWYVAQIHEKGLGVEPDYAQAAQWYRKAAEQGHSAAALALGTLYERGQGVTADPAEALRWFRQAARLPDDVVIVTEQEQAALTGELAELRAEVAAGRQRVDELERELVAARTADRGDAEAVARLERQLATARQQLALAEAAPPAAPSPPAGSRPAAAPDLRKLDYGPYAALVIGNAGYRAGLKPLPAARADAEAVAKLLEGRYGFTVTRLFDADRYQTLSALNRLRETLTEKHNLLLYYAGHSENDPGTGRSWWQPVDASPDNRTQWVSTAVITDHLDLIPARRVLLVSDAAFTGAVTRSGLVRLPTGMSPERRVEVVRQMLDQRVRMLLASGADAPVAAGAGTSTFARELLASLGGIEQVTPATELYRDLQRRARGHAELTPTLSLLQWARSEAGGDFFFVPRG